MLVAIDAGHGYYTAGKRTFTLPDGKIMLEHEFNNPVAKKLATKLNAVGIKTVFVFDPTGQVDYSYTKRVELANAAKADILVSIHANAEKADTWSSASGPTFYANKNDPLSINLGRKILNHIIKAYPYKDTYYYLDGSQGQALCMINQMPSVILECGFMTNLQDAQLLLRESYREACAQSAFLGIIEYAKERGLYVEKSWEQVLGEKSVDQLAAYGIIDSPDLWKAQDLKTTKIDAWYFFTLLARAINKFQS
jgi:N-acetylmuramoyl-L-alanine amidase